MVLLLSFYFVIKCVHVGGGSLIPYAIETKD